MRVETEIYTTENGHKVFAQLSPKNNGSCRLLIQWSGDSMMKATDARVYSDETLEEVVFMVSSSTGLRKESEFEPIAKAVMSFLKDNA